jgi:hypothetical protein
MKNGGCKKCQVKNTLNDRFYTSPPGAPQDCWLKSSASLSGNPLAGKPGFWWAENFLSNSYQKYFTTTNPPIKAIVNRITSRIKYLSINP